MKNPFLAGLAGAAAFGAIILLAKIIMDNMPKSGSPANVINGAAQIQPNK